MNSAHESVDRPANLTPRVNVLGVAVSTVDMHEALRRCEDLLESGGQGYVCAVDAHSVVEALQDPTHKRILNDAYLTVADGMPLVWMGRLRGSRTIGRVYGPDLLLEVCRLSMQRGWRHFFYGGAPGIADRLTARLRERLPGLQVVGTYTPPFRSLTFAEEAELATRVETTRPDVLWIGLGSPKQDRFMAEHYGKLQCNLMVGIGAAFDFHSGAVKEAPRWMHRTGLQWTHRLMQEPRRLGRRYLACVPVFLWNAGLELAGMKTFQLEA